ncbi:MAG: hypothetical protein K9M45_05700, partial [Kiritimatiellales bacterium]|nr:hypothetical protein [Kiritimatiellales bacterium]
MSGTHTVGLLCFFQTLEYFYRSFAIIGTGMDKKEYKTLKQEVGEQWRFLGALYSEENQTLSEDEAACLNPILHSLREGGRHYSEPEFVCAGGEKKIFKVRDLLTDRVVAMA